MNLCLYCKRTNQPNEKICYHCGYDLYPDALPQYKYDKLISDLKKEIENLKLESYHAYSNWKTQ